MRAYADSLPPQQTFTAESKHPFHSEPKIQLDLNLALRHKHHDSKRGDQSTVPPKGAAAPPPKGEAPAPPRRPPPNPPPPTAGRPPKGAPPSWRAVCGKVGKWDASVGNYRAERCDWQVRHGHKEYRGAHRCGWLRAWSQGDKLHASHPWSQGDKLHARP